MKTDSPPTEISDARSQRKEPSELDQVASRKHPDSPPMVFENFRNSLFGQLIAQHVGTVISQEEFDGLCRDAENGTNHFFDKCGERLLQAVRNDS